MPPNLQRAINLQAELEVAEDLAFAAAFRAGTKLTEADEPFMAGESTGVVNGRVGVRWGPSSYSSRDSEEAASFFKPLDTPAYRHWIAVRRLHRESALATRACMEEASDAT